MTVSVSLTVTVTVTVSVSVTDCGCVSDCDCDCGCVSDCDSVSDSDSDSVSDSDSDSVSDSESDGCVSVTSETVLPVIEAAADGDMYRLVTFLEPTSCSICKKLLRWLLSNDNTDSNGSSVNNMRCKHQHFNIWRNI